mgnify:FL=1
MLHKNQIIHPIFLMIFIGIWVFTELDNFGLSEFWNKDFNELWPSILYILIFHLILNTSKVVVIKKNEIIKGLYCLPFGFFKVRERMKISDINEIRLEQNEKLFYEVIVETNNKNVLLIKSIANKLPAEKELDRIKTEINSITNNGL